MNAAQNNQALVGFSRRAVLLIFSVPALGGALFGFDIGATSFVIAQMMMQNNDTTWMHSVQESPPLAGVVVASTALGATLGSLAVMIALQKKCHLGRRQELRYGAILYMMGTALQVLPGVWLLRSLLGLVCFLMGRLVYGIAVGIVMHAAPTYLAEQTPSSIRGMVVAGKEAAIVLGILLGNLAGDAFYDTTVEGQEYKPSWIYTYSLGWIMSMAMLILSLFIPRSCRWLLLQRETNEARESLRFVWNDSPELAERELETMQNALQEEIESSDESASSVFALWSLLWDHRYRAPLRAGVGLVVWQQITGQPSVLAYATPIFQQAGLSKDSTVLISFFKFFATLAAAGTVERWGRKKLLYIGCSLMLAALILLTFNIEQDAADNYSIMYDSTTPSLSISSVFVLYAMFVYIGGYQFSFGPISWLMISEVFPLDVRGRAVAFAVQMNFLCNAVVQLLVPVLTHGFGLNVTFGTFSVLTACSIYFIWLYVPETKGLTLEEIEEQFRQGDLDPQFTTPEVAELEPLVEDNDEESVASP